MLHRTGMHDVMSRQSLLYYLTVSCTVRNTQHYIEIYYLCYTIACCILLCRAAPCYAILCDAELRCAVPCLT